MCQGQEQTLSQVKDSRESAMNVNEDTVTNRLGATNKVCLYFIIAILGALLVFALAAIMVLVVQRTNTFEDYVKTLWSVPGKRAAAYMRVSSTANSSKLSLVEKGICEAMDCNGEQLVVKEEGLYFIFYHLNFHFPNCSKSPIDLKIELLVNDKVDTQMLSTFCASETCQDKTFKTLLQLHLANLKKDDKISVTLNHPQFLNDVFLPNENVLGVLRYNGM
uniref:TNF superfamily member 8 n=1 Tax=Catharus ustulatus TaxID=91951 RepID=A0A8C3YA45_CATUS